MKITKFKCVDTEGKELKADIFAKNAAVSCPACGFPVLFVEIENQINSPDTNIAECNRCKKKFQIEAIEEKQLLVVTEKI
jgi:DNA-directed RNA polymerase subunit RPC12/RpoP